MEFEFTETISFPIDGFVEWCCDYNYTDTDEIYKFVNDWMVANGDPTYDFVEDWMIDKVVTEVKKRLDKARED